MATAITVSHRYQTSQPKYPKIHKPLSAAIAHAVRLIHAICGLAGSLSLIDEIRADLRADKVCAAIRNHDTGPVFDWLMAALSYQGISDQVAYDYMEKHGRATWRQIKQGLGRSATCPKLKSYWHFHGCRYDKVSRTCAEPDHISRCPLPKHDLRNGRLNQTAYSLFLFIRHVADGDLVGWIDAQLQATNSPPGPDRLTRMLASLIESLREVYGVSDKVLAMALSSLLLGAPKKMVLWTAVGGCMIAIDTLVHNFLHRTGILARFNANHLYGAACYRPSGCADIIQTVAERIDARQFNPNAGSMLIAARGCARRSRSSLAGNEYNARVCTFHENRAHCMCDQLEEASLGCLFVTSGNCSIVSHVRTNIATRALGTAATTATSAFSFSRSSHSP
jgi:hypothetical protein